MKNNMNPIEKRRRSMFLTVRELSGLCLDVSFSLISMVENGKRRATDITLRKLAKVFGVKAETLQREIAAWSRSRS